MLPLSPRMPPSPLSIALGSKVQAETDQGFSGLCHKDYYPNHFKSLFAEINYLQYMKTNS